MQDALYSNQNLAGILREALGLAHSAGGRTEFSSASRELLRRALEHESAPETLSELAQTLELMEVDDETIASVRSIAAKAPGKRLQAFAAEFAKSGGGPG